MRGYYRNSRRVNYGSDKIKGLDYAVDGIGQFREITHADCKNPVGSSIELADGFINPNLRQQGRRIAKKAMWQKRYWSNKTKTCEIPNLDPNCYLPESVSNILIVIDLYDVPGFEKGIIINGVNSGTKNDTNLVFLNNVTNI